MKTVIFPPKKILIPMDASEPSHCAWLHAVDMARRFGASLNVVYVKEPLRWAAYEKAKPEFVDWMRKRSAERIRSWIGLNIHARILNGNPANTILKLSAGGRFDMIVMGTHGRTGMERTILGSVAETVIRSSPVPVWAVKAEPKPIKSILIPVNSAVYSLAGFQMAVEAASMLKAAMTVLRVVEDSSAPLASDKPLQELVHTASRRMPLACEPRIAVRQGVPVPEILEEARCHDLVVLVAHRKRLLQDMVLGTTVERVLRYAPIPILAVPAPQSKDMPITALY